MKITVLINPRLCLFILLRCWVFLMLMDKIKLYDHKPLIMRCSTSPYTSTSEKNIYPGRTIQTIMLLMLFKVSERCSKTKDILHKLIPPTRAIKIDTFTKPSVILD